MDNNGPARQYRAAFRANKMTRNTGKDSPHPLDVALGVHVRLRRKEAGLSQAKLAARVGLTFQQVQKYETGANRISFSRLVEIAHALHCSVHDLVGDLDKSKPSGLFAKQTDYLAEPGAAELLRAYASISSSKRRQALRNFVRQLAVHQD
jgi:transcriptional regulator with XRE-family HTH domain